MLCRGQSRAIGYTTGCHWRHAVEWPLTNYGDFFSLEPAWHEYMYTLVRFMSGIFMVVATPNDNYFMYGVIYTSAALSTTCCCKQKLLLQTEKLLLQTKRPWSKYFLEATFTCISATIACISTAVRCISATVIFISAALCFSDGPKKPPYYLAVGLGEMSKLWKSCCLAVLKDRWWNSSLTFSPAIVQYYIGLFVIFNMLGRRLFILIHQGLIVTSFHYLILWPGDVIFIYL